VGITPLPDRCRDRDARTYTQKTTAMDRASRCGCLIILIAHARFPGKKKRGNVNRLRFRSTETQQPS
jgi:hypothetical protein